MFDTFWLAHVNMHCLAKWSFLDGQEGADEYDRWRKQASDARKPKPFKLPFPGYEEDPVGYDWDSICDNPAAWGYPVQ